MSNLRARAREIKDAAAEERGNWEPPAAAQRVYNWWLETSPGNKARDIRYGRRRENLCHFGRVVLFWAPLMWAFLVAEQFVSSTLGKVFVATLFVASVVVVVIATNTWADLLAILGIAVAIILAGGLIVAGGVLFKEKVWRTSWNDTAAKVMVVVMAVAATVGVVALIVAAVMDIGWIFLAYLAAGALGLALAIGGFVLLSNFIAARRRLAKAKRSEKLEAYYQEHGEYPWDNRKPREPGVLSKFFTTVGDFIVFISQVVRVKKWKMCPFVEIETQPASDEYAF